MWIFFFSSRRRHTRWPRDWSSDVCSSDLRYGPDSDREIITLLEGFRRNGGKVVSIGQSYGVGRTIATENMAAAQELATSLIVAGHRRFATLQSSAGIASAADRTGGLHAALAAAELEPELTRRGPLARAE